MKTTLIWYIFLLSIITNTQSASESCTTNDDTCNTSDDTEIYHNSNNNNNNNHNVTTNVTTSTGIDQTQTCTNQSLASGSCQVKNSTEQDIEEKITTNNTSQQCQNSNNTELCVAPDTPSTPIAAPIETLKVQTSHVINSTITEVEKGMPQSNININVEENIEEGRHLTSTITTTSVAPTSTESTTTVQKVNETNVLRSITHVFGSTHAITGVQSLSHTKIFNVWNNIGSTAPLTTDTDKLEIIKRVMSFIAPLAVPSVVATSVQLRPEMAAHIASHAVDAAPHLALEITLNAVNQSFTNSASIEIAKATVLSVVRMLRNTTKTTYWTTTPLATLFQSVAVNNPTLKRSMVEVVQTLASTAQTQVTTSGSSASISLPGGEATLSIPVGAVGAGAGGETEGTEGTHVSVRSYECGLVSTNVAHLGQHCIGIVPHAFNEAVHLSYKVGHGATSCIKSSDEIQNDWRSVPSSTGKDRQSQDGKDGTCTIINGVAHVVGRTWSVFSYNVGSSGVYYHGNVPVGPVTYSRDVMTGYITRRSNSGGIISNSISSKGISRTISNSMTGTRALQKLPNVTYKVPNGTYENMGESTLIGFAIQPNITHYPSSKGIYFSTGTSIRREQNISKGTSSHGEIVVAGLTTITIHGHSLGTNLKDIGMILVKGTVCSSIFYISSQEIGCVSGNTVVTNAESLTPYDIKLTTITSGTSEDVPILNWQVRIAEGYTAPIIISVHLHKHTFHPTSIAVDHHRSYIYWSDITEQTIRRCKIDGTFIELILKGEHVGDVNDIKLTSNGTYMYYTDSNTNTLIRINVQNIPTNPTTGTRNELALTHSRTVVLSKLNNPRGITLDEKHSKIYLVELTGRIYECNIDGSNMELNQARPPKYRLLLIKRPSYVRLNSITIDTTSSPLQRRKHYLYWTELNSNIIMRSNMDGNKIIKIGGLNGNIVWPNLIQHVVGGDIYFSEYLGTIKKITPPLTKNILIEPTSTTIIDVKGSASDMINQEIITLSKVGGEFRFAVND